jgi:MATE family multidrug resistance protein
VLQLCNEVVNMLVISRTTSDPDVIAAVGLGNMIQNVFCLSVGMGLISAFDTLVSKAYGEGDHETTVVLLQRGRLVATAQLLWSAPVMWFSGDILAAIGQNPRTSYLAGEYNRSAVLGMPCLYWQEAFRSFLSNRSVATPPMVVTVVTSVLHPVWCVLFVEALRLGNYGLGLANTITWTLQFVLLLTYVLATAKQHGLSPAALIGTSREAWRSWGAFLAVALPSALQSCGEWWFWELCALVVGYLGSVPLAAHVATLNYVAATFMPTLGISQAAATVTGQSVGEKNSRKCSHAIVVSVVGGFALMLLISAVSICFRREIAVAYSRDPSTQDLVVTLLLIYYPLAGSCDCVQNILGASLRGLGHQAIGFKAYLFCFYGFMLPLGVVLAFPLHFGLEGIWFSMVAGLLVAVAVLSVLVRSAKSSIASSLT